MATLAQKSTLGNDPIFQGEVEMAILKLASTKLQQEKLPNKPETAYAKEVSHANAILNNPTFWKAVYAKAISSKSNLADSRTDALIDAAVLIAFPVMAGLKANEI